MASSGGNGVASRETVGHRGGAQQRGGSGKENGSDLSSSTSKKKQKDRANQESREAKRAATAAATDGVIAEVKKGKNSEKCCNYKNSSLFHMLFNLLRLAALALYFNAG